MQKYTADFGLQARTTPWPHRTYSDVEVEIEPFTRLEMMEEPRPYYSSSHWMVRFRIEGGARDYFADWKHFKKHTTPYE